MPNSNTFWWATAFMDATTVSGYVVALIAERNGNHTLYSAATALVLVALPSSAQTAHENSSGLAMLLAGILIIGGPALVGLGADGVVRLCNHIRNAVVPLGASIRSFLHVG